MGRPSALYWERISIFLHLSLSRSKQQSFAVPSSGSDPKAAILFTAEKLSPTPPGLPQALNGHHFRTRTDLNIYSFPLYSWKNRSGRETQTWQSRWGVGPKSVPLVPLPPLLTSKLISSLISPAQMPAPSETQLSVPATLGQGTFKNTAYAFPQKG